MKSRDATLYLAAVCVAGEQDKVKGANGHWVRWGDFSFQGTQSERRLCVYLWWKMKGFENFLLGTASLLRFPLKQSVSYRVPRRCRKDDRNVIWITSRVKRASRLTSREPHASRQESLTPHVKRASRLTSRETHVKRNSRLTSRETHISR